MRSLLVFVLLGVVDLSMCKQRPIVESIVYLLAGKQNRHKNVEGVAAGDNNGLISAAPALGILAHFCVHVDPGNEC